MQAFLPKEVGNGNNKLMSIFEEANIVSHILGYAPHQPLINFVILGAITILANP